MNTGHRLHHIRDLTDTHLGRQVTIGDLTGTLSGLIPVGGRYQAALVVGGGRVWTDALAGDTCVEVWRDAS